MNPEGGQSSSKLDILELGVDLGRAHEALVLNEDFLFHIFYFHKSKGKEFFQAENRENIRTNTVIWFLLDDYFHSPLQPFLLNREREQ